MSKFIGRLLVVLALGWAGSANSELIDRGGGMIYDSVLDITWLQDANFAKTSGYDADGRMTWDESQSWIVSLNNSNHLGITDWRLPTWTDSEIIGCFHSNDGTDCGYNVLTGTASTIIYSEMASLWTDTLGHIAIYRTAKPINGRSP
jgi:hypothetical protein